MGAVMAVSLQASIAMEVDQSRSLVNRKTSKRNHMHERAGIAQASCALISVQ
jgi:hypothetical protein